MPSEIDEMVDIADISLNSEPLVLEAINKAALGITHKVILMADLGDLRGIHLDELVETAAKVENEMPGLCWHRTN